MWALQTRGLLVANAAAQACEFVGMPECQYHLAHATVFLACSPKSNTAGQAYWAAKAATQKGPVQSVPLWLRDAHSKAGRDAGHGKGYLYSHDFPDAISGQEYMLEPMAFYEPGANGAEEQIQQRLRHWEHLKEAVRRKEMIFSSSALPFDFPTLRDNNAFSKKQINECNPFL